MPALRLSSDDVGAPTLNQATSSFYALLKWALPQLGWTIAFDDGVAKVVFRNDPATGSGSYLRVDCAATTSRFVVPLMYDSMTDIDTGERKTPPASAVAYWYFAEATTPDIPYFFIGDKKFFYVGFRTGTGTEEWQFFMAGDIVSRVPLYEQAVFSYNDSASGTASSGVFQGRNNISPNTDDYCHFVKDLAGTGDGETANPFVPVVGVTGAQSIGVQGTFADPISGESYLAPAWLSGPSSVAIRGRLPGSYWPMGDWHNEFVSAGSTPTLVPNVNTPDGVADCWLLTCNNGFATSSQMFSVLVNLDSPDWVGV